MDEETYRKYTETKQELPSDPASFSDDTISDEEMDAEEEMDDEEDRPRRRTRYYKKYEVMMKECETYVMAGKRLPKLHSRWIVNRYVNEHYFTLHSVPDHNRMVGELEALQREVHRLRRRVQELEATSRSNE